MASTPTIPLLHYRENWPSSKFFSELPSTLPPLPTSWSTPEYCNPRWFLNGTNRATVFSGLGTFRTALDENGFQTRSLVSFADNHYLACQPAGATEFSPGACQPGMTLAFVDEISVSLAPTSTEVWYNGACCDQNQSIDIEADWCVQSIAGPVTAISPVPINSNATLLPATIAETFTETCYPRPNVRDGLFPDGTECQSITTITNAIALSYPRWIWWQSSDWSSFEPSYRSSVAAAMRLSIDSPSSSARLSGGAIGGIVIGAVATIAIIILAIVLFLRYRRARSTQSADERGLMGNEPVETDGKMVLSEAPVPTSELEAVSLSLMKHQLAGDPSSQESFQDKK